MNNLNFFIAADKKVVYEYFVVSECSPSHNSFLSTTNSLLSVTKIKFCFLEFYITILY